MAKVGYARVSSTGQSLEVQLAKLKLCEKVFQEKKSGKTADRPTLQRCLEYVREGDTLVVTKLDRLARSTRDLLNMANALQKKGVELRVLDQDIDTATPAGKLMLTMLGAIAEFENDLRKERQADGIALAKEKGVRLGRKSTLSDGQLEELRQNRAEGVKIKDLMAQYGLSKASVYRLLGPSGAGI
jgi:DNA invertase Pin-like site-specific DNA recombinase